jgi:glutathione S-transferase
MRLYSHPNSTFSRRVRMALLEKQVDCEIHDLDFKGGEHRSAAYLALNPYGRMPTLEDGGFVLYESTAILEYLEAKHPAPPLLPSGARERALCAMHIKLCDLEIGVHTRALIFPSRFLPREKWDLPAMEAAREQIRKYLDVVERQLGDREWLVGDRYSLADLCVTPFAQFWEVLGIAPPPKVAAWTERLLARPSAQATRPSR